MRDGVFDVVELQMEVTPGIQADIRARRQFREPLRYEPRIKTVARTRMGRDHEVAGALTRREIEHGDAVVRRLRAIVHAEEDVGMNVNETVHASIPELGRASPRDLQLRPSQCGEPGSQWLAMYCRVGSRLTRHYVACQGVQPGGNIRLRSPRVAGPVASARPVDRPAHFRLAPHQDF